MTNNAHLKPPTVTIFKKFPIEDPVAVAAHVDKLEGSLLGLRRLTLKHVNVGAIGYPGSDKGLHVIFTFGVKEAA